MMPRLARFSLTWMPGGNGRFSSSSNTLGPRNPISAPGSATVMWPSDPHDANTPPVVGWRRCTRYGRPAALWSMIAREMSTICTKAAVPSCMRVPPEAVVASTGMPSLVARRTAATMRRAAAVPIEPARKPNSFATTATGRPRTSARPVMIDSSVPARSAAARRLAW